MSSESKPIFAEAFSDIKKFFKRQRRNSSSSAGREDEEEEDVEDENEKEEMNELEEEQSNAEAAFALLSDIEIEEGDKDTLMIFMKLVTTKKKTTNTFRQQDFTANQLFYMYTYCGKYDKVEMKELMEPLIAEFMENFPVFVETTEFLLFEQRHLRYTLTSDALPMEEIEIFKAVIRWADHQLQQAEHETTRQNQRNVLGDCLFEIRFPLMTIKDFSEFVRPRDILTAEEELRMFEYLTLDFAHHDESESGLGFKRNERKGLISESNLPSDSFPVRLYHPSNIQDGEGHHDEFDETWNRRYLLSVYKRIEFSGVGFLGPVAEDAAYDISIEPYIVVGGKISKFGVLRKRLFAKQRQVFYFHFDNPIVIDPNMFKDFVSLGIRYCLKGPQTQIVDNVGAFEYFAEREMDELGLYFQCCKYAYNPIQIIDLLFIKDNNDTISN